jgi:hypothetical protein
MNPCHLHQEKRHTASNPDSIFYARVHRNWDAASGTVYGFGASMTDDGFN